MPENRSRFVKKSEMKLGVKPAGGLKIEAELC